MQLIRFSPQILFFPLSIFAELQKLILLLINRFIVNFSVFSNFLLTHTSLAVFAAVALSITSHLTVAPLTASLYQRTVKYDNDFQLLIRNRG